MPILKRLAEISTPIATSVIEWPKCSTTNGMKAQ